MKFIKIFLGLILPMIIFTLVTVLPVVYPCIKSLSWFNTVSKLISLSAGGYLGSYIIAKTVINKDAEKKMTELSNAVQRSEKEKQTFLKNLEFKIKNWSLRGIPRQKFNSDVEYNAYTQGCKDAVDEYTKRLVSIIRFGVIETDFMFTKDWTNNGKPQ